MNVIKAGSKYQIYSEDVQTYKEIPAGTYTINFNPMAGFSLSSRPNLEVIGEKIYGNSKARIDKVLRSYSASTRNFGIILSGPKGVGKSVFVRLLCEQVVKQGLPVIVVDFAYDGIANFISSIEQDCVVVFDEFEKTFSEEDNQQDMLLSLFDGLDGGHKLFIVTCNDLNKVSEYMLNRPGRFHYHFTLGAPCSDEVREYMKNELKPEYHEVINDVVNLATFGDMPYDYLRAIAFDLNQGYSLKEVMADLNITRDTNEFDIVVNLSNGLSYQTWNEYIDPSDHDIESVWVRRYGEENEDIPDSFMVSYFPCEIEMVDGKTVIRNKIPRINWKTCAVRGRDELKDKIIEEWKDVTVTEIVLKKSPNANILRYTV